MRWKRKKKPKFGSRRVIKRFLLTPLCLNGEFRWLEWAYIEQMFGLRYWINMHWKDYVDWNKDKK